MRKPRVTEEQIIGILQEHAAGAKVNDLLRRHGISKETFYRWRKKYGGLQVEEAKRLRQLEEENRRLKRLVADQALNIQILKDVAGAKVVTPKQRRAAVTHVRARAAIPEPISERRACRYLGIHRALCRYRARRDPDTALHAIREQEQENQDELELDIHEKTTGERVSRARVPAVHGLDRDSLRLAG